MSAFFCDSSALVKRYVNETGSVWLTAMIDPKVGSYVFIARITFVEVVSAITRRERGGHVSAIDAATARNQFEKDYLGEFFSVEISETLILEAARLAPLTLLSADTDLNAAALGEGLAVDDRRKIFRANMKERRMFNRLENYR